MRIVRLGLLFLFAGVFHAPATMGMVDPLGDDEVILQTSHTGGNTMVFVAVAVSDRLGADRNLTTSYYTSNLYIYGDCEPATCSDPDGWDFVTSPDYGDPVLALGLYKIYHYDHPSYYFYVDLRDDRVVSGDPSLYFVDVYYRWDDGAYTWEWKRPGDGYYYASIDTGQTLKLWEQCGQTAPTNSKFQPTDPTDLTLSNYGGNPKLTWRRSEPYNAARYLVYRKGILITPSSISDTTYLDEDVSIGGGATFTYKVRAISGDGSKYSENYSNTVSTQGVYVDKINVDGLPHPDSFALLPAWPNPFNPTTVIGYQIPTDSHVKLAIYDLLGNEVDVLVNEWKEGGIYEVNFDAKELSSGVYIYRLETEGFVRNRKLVLLR